MVGVPGPLRLVELHNHHFPDQLHPGETYPLPLEILTPIWLYAFGAEAIPRMNGSPRVRTRKQAAAAAENQNGTANGLPNGSANTKRSASINEQSENIFLFYPNIIGYSRIFLAIASLYYMPLHPRTCSLLYSISCLLDALDGVAARYFEQSTQFGAVLDMVTDRCTTACLLVFLSSAWPRWALLFQGLISLDLASHYMHMYATLTMAGGGMSHKKVNEKRSKLLHLYYTNKVRIQSVSTRSCCSWYSWLTFMAKQNVLFTVCALNELFFIALYLLSFSSPTLSPSLLPTDKSPGSSSQPGSPLHPASTLFAAPGSAWAMELARANKMDSTWPWIFAAISSPVMAAKQILNVVQLVKASKWLAEGDNKTRREQGLPRQKNT